MSFSSPTKDVPLPLGEFLSWVSDVSRSWIGSRGALDAAAPRLSSPAQVMLTFPYSQGLPGVLQLAGLLLGCC